MYLEYTTTDEIKQIIGELKNNKASGSDGITNEMLTLSTDYISDPLCHNVNKCIECGKVSILMKEAKIAPIYKSGSRTDLMNYRPISLLSSLTKLFKKVIKKILVSYLQTNKILSAFQFSFQENRST